VVIIVHQNPGGEAMVAPDYVGGMAGCCDPSGYRGMFNERTARRSARAFERSGLDATAAPMVAALRGRGLEGASVLEIGAGSGTALVAMLDAGASAAVGIDLSPAYEKAAWDLVARRGHRDEVAWHTGDAVGMQDEIGEVDVVFGNRVVCCYPAMEEMVDMVTDKARALVALSYPRDRWVARVATRLINLVMWMRRNSFRTFVHDPEAIAARVEAAGFRPTASGTTTQWQWMVWEAA
jgi:SAM-dependent methyltransferase